MSVEQTTQLIQLILNSVLLSVACALILGGLTARHAALSQQLQSWSYAEQGGGGQMLPANFTQWSRSRLGRKQIQRLRYRYQITRYSVLSAYYALFFAGVSCLALVLRGMVEWNGLIPVALGLFVLSVATLLVAVGLTLIDWHFGDRAILDEIQKLLSFGQDEFLLSAKSRYRSNLTPPAVVRRDRQKMRAG